MPILTRVFAKRNDVLRKIWMKFSRLYALRAGGGDSSNWYPIPVNGNPLGMIERGWYLDDPSPADAMTVFLPIYQNHTRAFADSIGAFGFTKNIQNDPGIKVYPVIRYDQKLVEGKEVWEFGCKSYRKPVILYVPFGTPLLTPNTTPGEE